MSSELKYINESRFYMWRAIFAVAHADGIITNEETDFLSECFKREPFSEGQKEMLKRDLLIPQDAERMLINTSDEEDKIDFFIISEQLGASDGKFCGREKRMLNNLKKEKLLGFSKKILHQKISERTALYH